MSKAAELNAVDVAESNDGATTWGGMQVEGHDWLIKIGETNGAFDPFH